MRLTGSKPAQHLVALTLGIMTLFGAVGATHQATVHPPVHQVVADSDPDSQEWG